MPNKRKKTTKHTTPSTRSKSTKKKAQKPKTKPTQDDTTMDTNSQTSDGTPDRGNTTTNAKKPRTATQSERPSRPTNYQTLRRECNRSGQIRDKTRAQGNTRNLDTTYRSRATFKFSLPSSPNPLKTLTETLQELIKNLQETTERDIGIIPWKDNDIPYFHSLSDPDHIPSTIGKLLLYSPRIFPGKANKPNIVYAKLHIAHDQLFTDIQTELDYWLRSNNHGMYYNMLQVESVVDVGWLLYSLRCMDAGALAEELYDNYGIEIGLRWKVIDQGLKGKIPSEQRTSALHVESSLENKSATIKALLKLYGRSTSQEDKPNGVKFRFVTLRSAATNRSFITKLDRLRIRQKTFSTKICQTSSWDPVHLDHIVRDGTCSLRNYIMSILSSEYEDIGLFHSVDLDYNGDGFVFTYLPEVKAEAETAIQTLYPLIRHANNISKKLIEETSNDNDEVEEQSWQPLTIAELQSFFTQEAVERTEDMYYDNKKHCIIDPLVDNNLEFIIEEDSFSKLLGPDKDDIIATTENTTPGRPAPRVLHSSLIPEGDADSISTFGGSLYSRKAANSRQNKPGYRRPTSDESTIGSNSTVTTDDFNTLNHQVQSIITQFAQNQIQNDKILQLLSKSNSSTNRAGQPSGDDLEADDVSSTVSDRLE